MDEYGLLTFKSSMSAMAAQKVLKDIKFQVCPVLRMISASCGIALRISLCDVDAAKKLLEENAATKAMFDAYRIFTKDGSKAFEKI